MNTRFFRLGKNGQDIRCALDLAGKIINVAEATCPSIATYGKIAKEVVLLVSAPVETAPTQQCLVFWLQSTDGSPTLAVDRFQMNDSSVDQALDALKAAQIILET